MKAKILSLIPLFALLLVSTAILADGRPTGIRIGSVRNTGSSGVEIDVTVPGTDSPYSLNWTGNTSVWLDNTIGNTTQYGYPVWQYAGSSFAVPLPWAIDWGDGYFSGAALLNGPPGGPFTGTFAHTYVPSGMPLSYTITVGDVLCCSPVYIPPPSKVAGKGGGVTTGNTITGTNRFVQTWGTFTTQYLTFTSTRSARLAVTNTASVTTSTGIPALNIYGLLAMAFVLIGVGLLVYRKPQQIAA